ncbi:hypothetical protein GQ53DRAFT_834325 [Thozetella sp. PMI_491]|nr:hypothetical protein GQ53DRAFT_834325 [Thozetella sp. PMI_491]
MKSAVAALALFITVAFSAPTLSGRGDNLADALFDLESTGDSVVNAYQDQIDAVTDETSVLGKRSMMNAGLPMSGT